QNPEVPFFFSGRWNERAADFENLYALSAGVNVSFEHTEQSANQTRPERDMIFAQWISEHDGAFAKCGCTSRNQLGRARFEKSAGDEALAHLRFQIVRAIGLARRRESTAVCAGDVFRTIGAHDFFDEVDVALQVRAIARNLPFHDFGGADFLQ